MFTFGLISSIFDYLAFAILFIGFKADEGIFRSGWFMFSILTELTVLLIMRTQKPFFKSRPAPVLLYSSITVAAITLVLPYIKPISEILTIEPIRPLVLISLIGLLGLYVIVTEVAKHYFYKPKAKNK